MSYEHLDQLIVKSISEGKSTFSQIDSGMVFFEAHNQSKLTGRPAMRVIDGRLQALKKKGKIKFDKGWKVIK